MEDYESTDVYVEGPMIGTRVQWHKMGAGRNMLAEGTVLAFIGPNATNKEALDVCKEVYEGEYPIMYSYLRTSVETSGTERYLIASPRKNHSGNQCPYYYYAPLKKVVFSA